MARLFERKLHHGTLDWFLNLSMAGILSNLTPRDEDDEGPVPCVAAPVNDSCSRQVGL